MMAVMFRVCRSLVDLIVKLSMSRLEGQDLHCVTEMFCIDRSQHLPQ